MANLKVNKTEVEQLSKDHYVIHIDCTTDNIDNIYKEYVHDDRQYKNTYWLVSDTSKVIKVVKVDNGLFQLSTGGFIAKEAFLKNYTPHNNIFFQFIVGAKYMDRENSSIVSIYDLNDNTVEYSIDADTHYTLSKKAFRNKFFMLEKGILKNTPKFDIGETVYWYEAEGIKKGKIQAYDTSKRLFMVCNRWWASTQLYGSVSSLLKHLKNNIK